MNNLSSKNKFFMISEKADDAWSYKGRGTTGRGNTEKVIVFVTRAGSTSKYGSCICAIGLTESSVTWDNPNDQWGAAIVSSVKTLTGRTLWFGRNNGTFNDTGDTGGIFTTHDTNGNAISYTLYPFPMHRWGDRPYLDTNSIIFYIAEAILLDYNSWEKITLNPNGYNRMKTRINLYKDNLDATSNENISLFIDGEGGNIRLRSYDLTRHAEIDMNESDGLRIYVGNSSSESLASYIFNMRSSYKKYSMSKYLDNVDELLKISSCAWKECSVITGQNYSYYFSNYTNITMAIIPKSDLIYEVNGDTTCNSFYLKIPDEKGIYSLYKVITSKGNGYFCEIYSGYNGPIFGKTIPRCVTNDITYGIAFNNSNSECWSHDDGAPVLMKTNGSLPYKAYYCRIYRDGQDR